MEQKKDPSSNDREPTGGASPVPSISLPKGGGAIRGIGEKFGANPVSGTGSMTVPIATSPGRAGFGPNLSLSYDSGGGNGMFGFGWSLSLPSITRKTDKGLPQYLDGEESDVFIISGSEDLVPVLKKDTAGNLILDSEGSPVVDEDERDGFKIRRYRPRIEGLFARIERWTRTVDGDPHWRSISKDNILTVYGKDTNSRIADWDDPRRVFSWLICETRDDKGNVVSYQYKSEDGAEVDLTKAHERNRGPRDDPRRKVNRYLKRILYGNRVPLLDNAGRRPEFLTDAALLGAGWMFEVVFDFGEHDADAPKPNDDEQLDGSGQKKNPWLCRHDPFSSYRSGFEVRTYRLCQRSLMFHHFPNEPGIGQDCLVRSTDFVYRNTRNNPEDSVKGHPVASFVASVTQSGYRRKGGGGYLKRSMPPVEFEYSQVEIQQDVREIDAESLENLPAGIDGSSYQWVDLDGEGVSGILTEQAGAWFYKSNLGNGHFGSLRAVARKPSLAALSGSRQQLLDLAGDGQLDLAEFAGPTPGFFERTNDEDWGPFKPFASLPDIPWDEPNLRFVDLSGDGHADVLITENQVFTWYPSLAEEGFGPAQRVHQPLDEEQGARLVFADGVQSIYLADMSGDGLTDLLRIRNGEVCFWPNLGYGRFGARVIMDHAPQFDSTDLFSQQRLRLADIDGSGNNDIIYLGRDGIRVYFNESGNAWSEPQRLSQLPSVDDQSSIITIDLLGNGTACLVWSSPLPVHARSPVRYVDLMGGQKPHLLVKTVNNLGAETRVSYASSTRFYLKDKAAGTPWITKVPFPVYVVERIETFDYVSRNHFVTRYAYHHGYFDGVEREFRGFGLVEQRDTEEFAALSESDAFPTGGNIDAASHVPPVLTKTWFHTGVWLGRDHVSNFFAGLLDADDKGEYYRDPNLTDDEARQLLLSDTVLPVGLTLEEEREACRALKGSMLRQEVYALDGTDKAQHPYTVIEQNFTVKRVQPQATNRHGVFFTHAREAINYHYERDPADPRISHAVTLEVDSFGNTLKELAIGYGRRQPAPDLALNADQDKQATTLITYTENNVTNAIDDQKSYRTPLPSATRTYELTGFKPADNAERFSFDEWVKNDFDLLKSALEIPYEGTPDPAKKQKRPIEHVRTLYRKNDLTGLLPLNSLESRALPGESYKLAFTPGLLAQVYQRPRTGQPPENLIPNPGNVLGGTGADLGGYVDMDGDNHWWIPAGQVFYSPGIGDSTTQELNHARQHFFLARRYRDPFGQTTAVTYDVHDLLIVETRDPLGNRVTAGERDTAGNIDPNKPGNDYRVLQARLVSDPNRNRTEIAFDTLGLVVGTAVKGKDNSVGDSLDGFEPDPTQVKLDGFYDAPDPNIHAASLLSGATTRIIYDLDRFTRTRKAHSEDPTRWLPVYTATLARETHVSDPPPPHGLRIQISFSYSDGFAREVQRKLQAEPGTLVEGGPVVSPRWVGSAWTIFNNKGKPVRKYEPFFSQLSEKGHQFEFGVQAGVSVILFYDAVERVVATLHPNHTYEKVVFNQWRQITFDLNDTVAANGTETGDPRTDTDIKGYVTEYFKTQPNTWQTWHQQRITGAKGTREKSAAEKAAQHANTPTTAHFDSLGRAFLTLAHNGFKPDGTPIQFPTRLRLDIEGNQREVRDAIEQNGDPLGRVVMRYGYDMLGNRIHQASLEAGERWLLKEVTGKPIRAWDGLDRAFRTEYDQLRRPLRSFVIGADPADLNKELLTERMVYGEQHPEDQLRNLRGKLYLHLDQAGAATSEAFDFKGNLLRAARRLAQDFSHTVSWQAVDADHTALPADATAKLSSVALEALLAPLLEKDTFTSRTAYDALNRQIQSIAPRSDQPGAKRNVMQPVYNEANLLEQVHVWLGHPAEPGGLLDPAVVSPSPVGVSNIDYDAKGQRLRIEYKNGSTTRYAYDADTFRLVHVYTRRGATFTEDCENPQPPPPTTAAPDAPPGPSCGLQNLRYTYDPMGNITHIQDDAQQTIYFRNKRVEPSNDYTYDALYRLVEANGREHLGQVGGTPIVHSYNDAPRVGIEWSANDGKAMGTFTERYEYDAVGNFLFMKHEGNDPANPGWTRSYGYDEASLLEPTKKSNRLSSTTIGATTETYSTGGNGYDAHGNMQRMPQLQVMQWNFKDELQMTRRQAVNADDADGALHQGERTWYVYGSTGQRVRKVTESSAGSVKAERIYLGGFEVFRQRNGGGTVELQRETLHVMDDKERIALVETRTLDTAGVDPAPQQLIRFQLGNHLGSASLELDERAQIISYEEYTPYGSTSYQAVRSKTETPKRYSYTGKERDEESGLFYYGARYYAPGLGRWVTCDPAGFIEGTNVYVFCRNAPSTRVEIGGNDSASATEIRSAAQSALDMGGAERLRTMSEIGARFGIPSGGFRGGQSRMVVDGEIRLFWLLRTLSRVRGSEAAAANLATAYQYVPEVPSSLVMTTAARENTTSVTARGSETVNTWEEGGLDFLWQNRNSLGLPRTMTRHWTAAPTFVSPETGNVVHPGNIPARDQVPAYAAQIRMGFTGFERQVRDEFGNERGNAVLAAMSDEARLVWQAYSFLAPGGVDYNPRGPSQHGQRFGVHTALGYLIDKSNREGREADLNELLRDPTLNRTDYIRIAKVRAAEATFFDERLHSIAPASPPTSDRPLSAADPGCIRGVPAP